MIYLDTHIVIWLYVDESDRLPDLVKSLIDSYSTVFCSPIVRLELQYLYEIGRITDKSDAIISDLSSRIGLRICQKDFNLIIGQALEISWTRDAFDRLIVAHASLDNDILLTKDQKILENYDRAVWSK